MTQKQSILGRVSQLARANINALIDRAEDPQKMLDQLVRDYTNSIAEAEEAVAQTLGNLRLAEADLREDKAAVHEWGNKALVASQAAERARVAGKADEAQRYDELAKVALTRQLSYEREVRDEEPLIASQAQTVEKLKAGLVQMKEKLGELKTRRDQLVARQRTAAAQQKVTQAVGAIDILDPTSELSRFEEQVRREEAMAAGRAELAASGFDAQFAELEVSGDALEVEARLAALKQGPAPQLPSGQ